MLPDLHGLSLLAASELLLLWLSVQMRCQISTQSSCLVAIVSYSHSNQSLPDPSVSVQRLLLMCPKLQQQPSFTEAAFMRLLLHAQHLMVANFQIYQQVIPACQALN